MRKYRITKYNPYFRDENGVYTLNEWTSFWDIDKIYYDGILTRKAYYEMENKYVQAIKYILNDHKIASMVIVQIEKHTIDNLDIYLSTWERDFIDNLKQDLLVENFDIEILCKMILREFLWAKLQTSEKKLVIEFGYDYYMYVTCDKINDNTKDKIIKMGLFIEEI